LIIAASVPVAYATVLIVPVVPLVRMNFADVLFQVTLTGVGVAVITMSLTVLDAAKFQVPPTVPADVIIEPDVMLDPVSVCPTAKVPVTVPAGVKTVPAIEPVVQDASVGRVVFNAV
jgi:hypothetical protein